VTVTTDDPDVKVSVVLAVEVVKMTEPLELLEDADLMVEVALRNPLVAVEEAVVVALSEVALLVLVRGAGKRVAQDAGMAFGSLIPSAAKTTSS